MTQPDWAQIAAADFKVSAGQASALFPAAFDLLASAEAHERDGLAYPALATWLESGLLDGQLAQVADQVTGRLGHREVYARSFAALLLAEVLSRDAHTRELARDDLHRLQRQWADWYVGEPDLRSHTPELGWLHALAHGADVAAVLALHPATTRGDLKGALDTLLKRLKTVTTNPVQYEDDRLALAAFVLLTRSPLTAEDRQHWLEQLGALLSPGAGSPRSAATAFAVQFARALLMFTHYGAQLPDGTVIPAPAPDEVQTPLLAALKNAFPFAYP